MMHVRGLVLLLLCLPGHARRTHLEASAESREALIPGGFRTGVFPRAGQRTGAGVGKGPVVTASAAYDTAVLSETAMREVQDLIAEMTSSPATLKETLQKSPRLQALARRTPAVADALKNPATLAQEMQILDAMSQLLTGMRGALSNPLKRQQALEQLKRLQLETEQAEVPAAGAPYFARPAMSRAGSLSMQLGQAKSGIVSYDRDGGFENREISKEKPPVKLLNRLSELQVLTSIADLGLLAKAEEAGVFSKLEKAGGFSLLEKLLPLVDDLQLLGTLENLINVPAYVQVLLAAALLGGEAALIAAVPDDNAVLIAVQALTGLLAGGGAVTLLASAYLLSLLQGED